MKKCVKFENRCNVREIPHIKELSEEERAECWLQRSDSYATQCEVRVAKMMIFEKTFQENDGCTIRGLEQWIPDEGSRRLEAMKSAIQAVLKEQNIQKNNHTDPQPEKLRKSYKLYSRYFSAMAYKVGLEDEKEARRFFATSDGTNINNNSKSITKQFSELYNSNVRLNARRQMANLRARFIPPPPTMTDDDSNITNTSPSPLLALKKPAFLATTKRAAVQ